MLEHLIGHDDDLLALSLSDLKQARSSPSGASDDRPAPRAPGVRLTGVLSHPHIMPATIQVRTYLTTTQAECAGASIRAECLPASATARALPA